ARRPRKEAASSTTSRRATILAGAGCSTESGIPDYRGPTTRTQKRSPVQYRQFVSDPEWRRRYWARAVVGWPHFVAARPNPTHRALAALEHSGHAPWLVTQNVDGLHQSAGSSQVNELHGTLHRVRCLECGAVCDRERVQERLLDANPWIATADAEVAPDGDAELPQSTIARFEVVDCERCGGVLKPDVVYFGENVPKARVEQAFQWLDCADVLLVVGSSLTVFSGYRFVRKADEHGIPVVIVNLGETRGDAHASLKIDARLGLLLPAVAQALAS
ncbi:MAG: NAD-dependent protein deacetylase, partial [Myxococcota bacterium]